MTNTLLTLPDTPRKQLRRRQSELSAKGVTLSQYLSFGLMRELGDTVDKLKEIRLFDWDDDLLDQVEQFYQSERSTQK